MGGGQKEVKSTHGIEAFYMYFNGTGIWGGETIGIYLLCKNSLKALENIARTGRDKAINTSAAVFYYFRNTLPSAYWFKLI